MRLYAIDFCLIGALGVYLACTHPAPSPTTGKDYYCEQTRSEYVKFKSLTGDEIAALRRPRKEAILSVIKKFERLCS